MYNLVKDTAERMGKTLELYHKQSPSLNTFFRDYARALRDRTISVSDTEIALLTSILKIGIRVMRKHNSQPLYVLQNDFGAQYVRTNGAMYLLYERVKKNRGHYSLLVPTPNLSVGK